jgi:hypothetical protein
MKHSALLALGAFAMLVFLTAAAHAAPAPFECPWTAETEPVPSSCGNYGSAGPC